MLSKLKEINRHLDFVDPRSDDFAAYGRYLSSGGWDGLISSADRLIPKDDNPAYIASITELEELKQPDIIAGVFGEEAAQVGICRGFNRSMNGMEWHDCPEILIAITPLLLLLGTVDEMKDDQWNSRNTKVCYLEAGEGVVLNAGTLHFAPCRPDSNPFLSLIILPKGVNEALSTGYNSEKNSLLWKERKWILTHRDSPQAAAGAPIGISGPNLEVNTL